MAGDVPKGSTPPVDPEVQRLQQQLERAKLQAELAQARKTALTASLPETGTTPLAGTTTLDSNVVIETEILAYRMMRGLAAKIADDVARAAAGRAILIYNEADLNALTAFRAFQQQIGQLGAAFDELAPPPETPGTLASVLVGTAVATVAAKTVVDLVSLFRHDRVVTGIPMTMEDLALVSEVGGALAKKQTKVFITYLYPHSVGAERIEGAMDDLRARAAEANQRILGMPDGQKKEVAQRRFNRLDEGLRQYEDMVTGTVGQGSNALAALVRGAGIDAILGEEPGANVLYLKILKVAGSNETRRTLLSTTVKRSGGVIVNYILFDADGSILRSGTADTYSGIVDEVEK